jgi:hypothetical protein
MEKSRSIYFVFVILLAIYNVGYAQHNKLHPDESLIPHLNQVAINFIYNEIANANESSQRRYTAVQSELSQFQNSIQIGKETGGKGDILGRIVDVETDSMNNIYVLDQSLNQILVYNQVGDYLYEIGRSGKGPGEFQNPIDIEIDQNDILYVADRYFRLSVFKKIDRQFVYDKTIQLEHSPDQICIIDKNLFYRAVGLNKNMENSYEQFVVHKISLRDGSLIKSFGKTYQSNVLLVSNQLSDGNLLCDSKNEIVVITYDSTPYFFAFDLDGELQWVTKINSFRQREIREIYENSVPGIKFVGDGNIFDSIQKLQKFGSDFIIGQMISRPSGRNVDFSRVSIQSFVISVKDGEGSFINTPFSNEMILDISKHSIINDLILVNGYPSLSSHIFKEK